MIREMVVVLACTGVLALEGRHATGGMIVNFTGTINLVSGAGQVDAISQYLAAGDTFTGSFRYDPAAAGGPLINGSAVTGDSQSYSSALAGFTLTFTRGQSQGHSINGLVETHQTPAGTLVPSHLSLANNVIYGGVGPVDLARGFIAHANEEFRPGLTQSYLGYELLDFNAAMLNSTDLADWDPGLVFAAESVVGQSDNYLVFESTQTGQAQLARFRFSTFHAELQPEVTPIFDQVVIAEATAASLFGGAIQSPTPGGLDVLFDTAPAEEGDLLASYADHTAATLTEALSQTSGFDLGNFATGVSDRYQLWDLDFTGTLSDESDVILQFRYDDTGLSAAAEEGLGIWHYGQYGSEGNREWKWLRDEIDTTNNTITVTVDHFSPFAPGFQAVPEPSSLVLLGMGAFGLLGYGRRRKRTMTA